MPQPSNTPTTPTTLRTNSSRSQPNTPSAISWPIGDILGADRSLESKNTLEIYGYIIHWNDCTQLVESIAEHVILQQWYTLLLSVPMMRYHLPSRAIGKRFLNLFTKELGGIWARCWNVEKFLSFPIVILQYKQHMKGSLNMKNS